MATYTFLKNNFMQIKPPQKKKGSLELVWQITGRQILDFMASMAGKFYSLFLVDDTFPLAMTIYMGKPQSQASELQCKMQEDNSVSVSF